jgi:lipoyl(octanoyl) transferase
MAIDQALLEGALRNGPSLRLYGWQPACLSFGRNQLVRGIYDPARAHARGMDVVRRPTGGLAVLHDAELTYALAAPVAVVGRPRKAYRAITEALVTGLRGLGVLAAVASADAGARAPAPTGTHPCFDGAAPGEIIAGDLKLVGSAQRTEGGCLLQHGSILLAGEQSIVSDLRFDGAGGMEGSGPRPGNSTLAGILGVAPAAEVVAAAIAGGFEEAFGIRLAPDALTHAESMRALDLEHHFGDDAWTWRR